MKPSKAEEKEKPKEAKMLDVDEEEERASVLDDVEDKLKQEEAHEQDIFKGKPIGKIVVEKDDYDNVKIFFITEKLICEQEDMAFEEIEDEF